MTYRLIGIKLSKFAPARSRHREPATISTHFSGDRHVYGGFSPRKWSIKLNLTWERKWQSTFSRQMASTATQLSPNQPFRGGPIKLVLASLLPAENQTKLPQKWPFKPPHLNSRVTCSVVLAGPLVVLLDSLACQEDCSSLAGRWYWCILVLLCDLGEPSGDVNSLAVSYLEGATHLQFPNIN